MSDDTARWSTGEGTLLFTIPTPSMLEHVAAAGRDPDDDNDDPFDDNDDPFTVDCSTQTEPGTAHRVWWWHDDTCTGDDTCACGRITLLEALQLLGPDQRGQAVKAHADEMRQLYEHFWGGQGMVSGESTRVGDACPDCLIEGAVHVWGVYADAGLLAEEFGEALAAYAYELAVGEPRYVDANRSDEEPPK